MTYVGAAIARLTIGVPNKRTPLDPLGNGRMAPLKPPRDSVERPLAKKIAPYPYLPPARDTTRYGTDSSQIRADIS